MQARDLGYWYGALLSIPKAGGMRMPGEEREGGDGRSDGVALPPLLLVNAARCVCVFRVVTNAVYIK
jgi:hypothetical protein